MESIRSTLLPTLVNYLKKFTGEDCISRSQIILRAYKSYSNMLTDGFFSIEVKGVEGLEQNTFIRVKVWRLLAQVDNILMVVLDYAIIGFETMSDFQVKPLKSELQIKALTIPAFRIQIRSTITETPIQEIFDLANSIPDD